MTVAKKNKGNRELENVLSKMLKDAKEGIGDNGEPMSLTDKMKIIDRVLKWEAIKSKMEQEQYGSGFEDD